MIDYVIGHWSLSSIASLSAISGGPRMGLKDLFIFIYTFVYFIYFIFGCVGSLLLHAGFLWLR